MCPAFVSQDWFCDSWETGLHLPLAEVPLCFGQDFCNASGCQPTCILRQKASRIGLSTTGQAPRSWFDDFGDNWMFHCPKSDRLWSQSLAKIRSSTLKSIGFCMSPQHLLWWTWWSTLWFVIGIPGSVVVQSILLYWYAFTHPLIQSASSQTPMACHLWSLHDISLDFGWRCCKFGGRFETLYAGYLRGQGKSCWIVVLNLRLKRTQLAPLQVDTRVLFGCSDLKKVFRHSLFKHVLIYLISQNITLLYYGYAAMVLPCPHPRSFV